jgi:hypothetical protein
VDLEARVADVERRVAELEAERQRSLPPSPAPTIVFTGGFMPGEDVELLLGHPMSEIESAVCPAVTADSAGRASFPRARPLRSDSAAGSEGHAGEGDTVRARRAEAAAMTNQVEALDVVVRECLRAAASAADAGQLTSAEARAGAEAVLCHLFANAGAKIGFRERIPVLLGHSQLLHEFIASLDSTAA